MLNFTENWINATLDPMTTKIIIACRIDVSGLNIFRFSQVGMDMEENLEGMDGEEHWYDTKDLIIGSIDEFVDINKRNHTIS